MRGSVCLCEEITHVEWEVCVCVEGGWEVVVGVRFPLVRLRTFLTFRPSGCLRLLGRLLSRRVFGRILEGFYVGGIAPAAPLVQRKPHTL